MKNISTVKFKGRSGTGYDFHVYPSSTDFNDVSAVYVLSKRYQDDRGTWSHRVAYIGESAKLGTRLNGHEKWTCANGRGANVVCVHQVSGEANRLQIEKDLISAFNPPCNG